MADEKTEPLSERDEALAQRIAKLLADRLEQRERDRVIAATQTHDTPLPVEHQDPPALKTR